MKPGVVLFTADLKRLAQFYAAVTDLSVTLSDDQITVLESDTFQLVVHLLAGEPAVSVPPRIREDSYLKPFFPVASLAETRKKAAAYGGQLRPASAEWEAPERGFRACEASDPDGNVIQFREPLTHSHKD
jgi:predicted enzyme related to lactoylglutathione lyase